ncbi:hypothetical protein CRENBAI_013269 [Crenichthys baileyi]|uniref:Uncharacterized protein n=1 Tax=Crenichthys baileyi TaxID=28760 RepID=A0AAV9RJW5_9TELE
MVENPIFLLPPLDGQYWVRGEEQEVGTRERSSKLLDFRNPSCLPLKTMTKPDKQFLGCSPQYPTAPSCRPALQRSHGQTDSDTQILTLLIAANPPSVLPSPAPLLTPAPVIAR